MSGDDLRALAADLTQAAGKAQRRAGDVIRKGATDIEARAKQIAPVDTGALRNSISTSLSFGSLTAEIGPTVYYAPFVEYGTRRMAPKPYMAPAFDAVAPSIEQALTDLGGDIL